MKEDQVTKYFDQNALEWAKHYQKGNLPLKLFNMVFRRGLTQRFEATMRRALPAEGRSYLDVGCGTGVYSLTLATAGAAQVTGVDAAPGMIELCKQAAQSEGIADRCRFRLGHFMELEFTEKFDLIFAMGVFDYIQDYRAFWSRMISLSRGAVIGSFPGHTWPRTPVRKFRYQRMGLPVYFYRPAEVEELGRFPGLSRYEVDDFGAGYVLTGYVA